MKTASRNHLLSLMCLLLGAAPGFSRAQAQAEAPAPNSTLQQSTLLPFVLDLAMVDKEKFIKAGETNASFQTIAGRRVFDGLPFQVDGHGCVYGRNQARTSPGNYSDFIGLRVGRKFDELHLIHATRWADVDGETIALIRLNYADGSKHEFSIRFGGHVRDWQRLRSEEKEVLTDPDSKVIWRAPGIAEYKASSRLFKSRLANPHPEKVVTTMDVVSTRHMAAYDLFAATVAARDPKRVMTPALAPDEPERHFDGAVVVHVTDQSNGQPIPHVLVEPSMNVDDTGVIGSPLYTSASGEAIVRYPSEKTGNLYVSVEKEGYSSRNASANLASGLTNRLEFELRKAPMITGTVRRPDGRPAAGLEVRIIGAFGGGQEATPTTDANGKFTMAFSPQQFGGSERTPCLLVRDPEHNLAAAQDLDEESGPLDLRLVPGLTLVGRAESDGKPIANATAALVFWTGNSGMHLQGLAVATNIPGHFEIPALPPGRRYGLYVSAPGFGQKYVNATEAAEEAKRVELDTVELKPANLKLAGQVVDADDKPVTGANVYLNGEGQPNGNTQTGRDGKFSFAHVCEGPVSLHANAKNSYGNVSAEGGDTNVVLKLGESPSYSSAGVTVGKLKGVITGPDGKPVTGAEVAVFPDPSHRTKTATNGAYSLQWQVQPWQMQQGGDPCFVVRDVARNLAAAEDISVETTNLNVQLKPAWTVTGRVEGPDGAPLTNAQVGVWLFACRTYSQLSEQLATTDAQGRFTLKALPPGPKYMIYATAKGYGRRQQELDADITTNSVELQPFVLQLANKTIAGRVINAKEKPAAGVHVSLSGEGQPSAYMATDSKGHFSFKVCEGEIRLFASGQNGYANLSVEAGDTNIVIQLTSSGGTPVRSTPKRASLAGKPLPDLAGFGLPADAAPTGKPLLLCLLDAEQRPSRRTIRLLADKCPTLTRQGIPVLAIQAAMTSADTLQSWTNSSPLPFPLGRVAEKSAANHWATDVESLPWFILRDAKGIVTAEGFSLDELEAKLQDLKTPAQN